MTKKNVLHYGLMLIIIIYFIACNNKVIFSDYQILEDGEWAKDKEIAFNVEIKDIEPTYELDLILRNSDMFPRQNLWLKVEQEHNGMTLNIDTINLFLIDENGKWTGSGFSSNYDNTFIWKQKVKFSSAGSYIYRFHQLMRFDILEGIQRIGLEVIKEK